MSRNSENSGKNHNGNRNGTFPPGNNGSKKINGNGSGKLKRTTSNRANRTRQSSSNGGPPSLSLLDYANRRIISLLLSNPAMTQMEMAKELSLSQSSIALRLDKLKASGLLKETKGIYAQSIGLEMSRLDVESEDVPNVVEFAQMCPLFVNGTVSVGAKNLSLFFVAEDLEMFQYIADYHIRRLPGVKALSFVPIISWTKQFVVPIDLNSKKLETPPCGILPYCPRCPTNPSNNGKIWGVER